MKRKLKIVFILITLSLAGIIVFQLYWTSNAYSVNKKIFDGKVIVAMQLAMDRCKKDYFDSIRTVLVKRLSDPSSVITIDTASKGNTSNNKINPALNINFSFHGSINSNPFQTDAHTYNYYRANINHKATVPEVLTEMSFYVPTLMMELTTFLGVDDAMHPPPELSAFIKTHPGVPSNKWPLPKEGIYALPPNYKQADSLKLSRYFALELQKMNIDAPFILSLSNKGQTPQDFNFHYSETNENVYQYHGFIFLLTHYTRQDEFTLFAKATIHNPQYAVIKGMMITLVLSALLVLFTIYCFYYIIRTINQQKALGELKDDFINNMTHELKTPIATITVAIEGLQKFNALNDPEKTQRYLQTSRNELAKLNELVSKVLDVAAFECDKIILLKEKIEVDALMNELITAEKAKAGKTISIAHNNRDRVDDIVADKLHFGNAILNVLDNAVKYSNEPVDIKIDVYRDGHMIVFSISDKGIGIPAAHLGRIFEKFHRVPTGNVHNVKGTGLGLSYVKYIAEAHGGHVTVKSEVNAGSQFIISIPM
ncbi:His Kinase A (phospho-acceptor) domain-containing protein [Mucilaginibacter lappiensis]|uniref:histidine kinase n=1 Tax=Mucilaginibacter lappiensis TaxID=354630 RepID=A0ABR6PHF0_9SPHI|nr:HAMP domain-containing sensor histidine kinase [Mucilaginibacter lappiensis]MBB6108435.1 signal transduction histidine kinase [Mucilaginibacter lappiensis]SIQ38094.1 His Kinase A (phospho-acceptor) domain-containing protein [Mucilaginibacter lappiensis]